MVTIGTIDSLSQAIGVPKPRIYAAHEAGLQLLGLDNNVIPYGVDAVIPRAAYRGLGYPETKVGKCSYKEFPGTEVPTRIWAPVADMRCGRRDVGTLKEYGVGCLRPRRILDALPASPDFPYLKEQFAFLAEVLFADEMSDEELSQFLRYVRG